MRKFLLFIALFSLLACAACTVQEESQPGKIDNAQEKVSAFLRGENEELIEEIHNAQK